MKKLPKGWRLLRKLPEYDGWQYKSGATFVQIVVVVAEEPGSSVKVQISHGPAEWFYDVNTGLLIWRVDETELAALLVEFGVPPPTEDVARKLPGFADLPLLAEDCLQRWAKAVGG